MIVDMNNEVDDILSQNHCATISSVGVDTRPWAAPVWFAYDNQRHLYWWSSKNSQHSQNIDLNNEVYITIFNSQAPEGKGAGVYIRATAEVVPDNELDLAVEIYNQSTTLFKLNRENTTNEAPTRLYRAKPIRIQINDSREMGVFYEDIRRDVN